MLANILPGFRDLRTPLVTGYVYAFSLWICLGKNRIIPDEPDSQFLKRV